MESVSESPVDLLGSDQGLSKKLMTFPIRLETITSFYLLQLIGGAIFFTFSNRLEEVYSINLPQSIGDHTFLYLLQSIGDPVPILVLMPSKFGLVV